MGRITRRLGKLEPLLVAAALLAALVAVLALLVVPLAV